MKKTFVGFRPLALAAAAVLALAACSEARAGNVVTVTTSAPGDATYAWNSKYGPWGYGQGGPDLGVGLQMGGQYGNDYTVGIVEIPIGSLQAGTLLDVQLVVNTTGFGTGYYYGSAAIGWLNTGNTVLTGDVVADGLGPLATGRPNDWSLWNSDTNPSGLPAQLSFDFTTQVAADVAAGRAYSVFVISGSRETWGGIMAAESGLDTAARLVVDTTAPVPEPEGWLMLLTGLGMLGYIAPRRRADRS